MSSTDGFYCVEFIQVIGIQFEENAIRFCCDCRTVRKLIDLIVKFSVPSSENVNTDFLNSLLRESKFNSRTN